MVDSVGIREKIDTIILGGINKSNEQAKIDSRYVKPKDVETQVFPWETIKWLSEPRGTYAHNFSMGVVLLAPGKGHDNQSQLGIEEILYVVSREGGIDS